MRTNPKVKEINPKELEKIKYEREKPPPKPMEIDPNDIKIKMTFEESYFYLNCVLLEAQRLICFYTCFKCVGCRFESFRTCLFLFE